MRTDIWKNAGWLMRKFRHDNNTDQKLSPKMTSNRTKITIMGD